MARPGRSRRQGVLRLDQKSPALASKPWAGRRRRPLSHLDETSFAHVALANCESWVRMVSPHALVSSSRLGSGLGPGHRGTGSTASRPVGPAAPPTGAGVPSRAGPPPRRKAPSATFAWAGPGAVGVCPSGGDEGRGARARTCLGRGLGPVVPTVADAVPGRAVSAGPVPPKVASTAFGEPGEGLASRGLASRGLADGGLADGGLADGGLADDGPVRSPRALSRRSSLSNIAPGLRSREGETRRTRATSSVTRGSTESRMSTRASPTVSMARTSRGKPIWRAYSARRGAAVPGRSTRDGA